MFHPNKCRKVMNKFQSNVVTVELRLACFAPSPNYRCDFASYIFLSKRVKMSRKFILTKSHKNFYKTLSDFFVQLPSKKLTFVNQGVKLDSKYDKHRQEIRRSGNFFIKI